MASARAHGTMALEFRRASAYIPLAACGYGDKHVPE
jgi:hypothetical protein